VLSSCTSASGDSASAMPVKPRISGNSTVSSRFSPHQGLHGFLVRPGNHVAAGWQQRALPLHAAFNNKILGIDEDTGVQVEVKLSYTQDGQPGSIELTRPMTLYGKNAIQWADFRSVGAFVTPKDDTLKDFVRQAVTQYQPTAALNRPLLQAMTLFDVLAAHGLRYQADPNSPYSKVSGEQVDYVQFPRETLKLKNGLRRPVRTTGRGP
jgi:hypothetical protein